MPDLDTTPVGDIISSSSQGADTSASEPASADTSSANQSANTSATSPAQADTQSSGDTSKSGAEKPSEAMIPESRYKSLQAEYTRTSQTRAEYERRIQEMERKLAEREQSNEPVYSPKHPRNADFRKSYDAYAQVRTRLSQKYDSAQTEQALKGIFGDTFAQFREYEGQLEERKREAFTDPEAWFEKKFQERFQQTIPNWQRGIADQFSVEKKAQDEVQSWISQNKTIATPDTISKMAKMMQDGATFNEAKYSVERDYYKSQISGAEAANMSADEKQRLLEQNASHTITRTPSTNRKVDIQKVFSERGIDRNNQDRKIATLMELDANGQL